MECFFVFKYLRMNRFALIVVALAQLLVLSCRRKARPDVSTTSETLVASPVAPVMPVELQERSLVVVMRATSASGEVVIQTGDGIFDYAVDWDNDGAPDEVGLTGHAVHEFGAPGEYTIRLTGKIPHLMWCASELSEQEALEEAAAGTKRRFKKLWQEVVDVKQWGTIRWESMRGMFAYCQEIDRWSATDSPSLEQVKTMRFMFLKAGRLNQPLEGWDVSTVMDMRGVFNDASSFDQPLAKWDVSSARDMSMMFSGAYHFNQPLAQWDVSSVRDMSDMFYNAQVFNQPLEGWDVSRVEDMSGMFRDAEAFNQPLVGWSVSSVTDMSMMFQSTGAFNQPLEGWDVSSVTNMQNMFDNARAFNQPLNAWDVSAVQDMSGLFFA